MSLAASGNEVWQQNGTEVSYGLFLPVELIQKMKKQDLKFVFASFLYVYSHCLWNYFVIKLKWYCYTLACQGVMREAELVKKGLFYLTFPADENSGNAKICVVIKSLCIWIYYQHSIHSNKAYFT